MRSKSADIVPGDTNILFKFVEGLADEDNAPLPPPEELSKLVERLVAKLDEEVYDEEEDVPGP